MSYDCRIQTVGPSTHSLYITAARSLCSAAYGFVAECASIHYVSAFTQYCQMVTFGIDTLAFNIHLYCKHNVNSNRISIFFSLQKNEIISPKKSKQSNIISKLFHFIQNIDFSEKYKTSTFIALLIEVF